MPSSAEMARGPSSKAGSEVPFTPELQRSQSFFGDSDDDESVHPTPSDSTAPLHVGLFPSSDGKGSASVDREEEARNIHYIDSLFDASVAGQVADLASLTTAPAQAGPSAAAHLAPLPSSSSSTLPMTSSVPPPRKRGRPRKNPLPDNTAFTSAATNAPASQRISSKRKRLSAAVPSQLLSVPDLGQFIPQTSSSDAAQDFIQNNLQLFSDLLVASQHQAPSRLTPNTDSTAPRTSSSAAKPVRRRSASSSKSAAPGDDLRAEVKKRMAEVALGHDGLREELVKMNVDMHFYENAHKTVDERIRVLRDRIAKRSTALQQEREVTRKAREEGRKSKAKATRTESRLDPDLQRHFTSEEGHLEEDVTPASEVFNFESLFEPSSAHATVEAPTEFDKGVAMSDEELAKVLGISTQDLTGFSTSLDIASDSNANRQTASVLPSGAPGDIQTPAGHIDQSSFDVAAFLEMASAAPTTEEQ